MPYRCPDCGSNNTYKEVMFGHSTSDRKCAACGNSDLARNFWVDEADVEKKLEPFIETERKSVEKLETEDEL